MRRSGVAGFGESWEGGAGWALSDGHGVPGLA